MILRIDDRLIHGQVITGWVKTLNLNNIIVANNALAKDKEKQKLIRLAVPLDVRVEFLTLEQTTKAILKNKWKNLQSIILVESPKDAYTLVKNGCKFNSINVGGLHFKDGKVQITPNIALNETDKKFLYSLHKRGILLEGRALPSDEAYNVIKVLESFEKKNGNNRGSKI